MPSQIHCHHKFVSIIVVALPPSQHHPCPGSTIVATSSLSWIHHRLCRRFVASVPRSMLPQSLAQAILFYSQVWFYFFLFLLFSSLTCFLGIDEKMVDVRYSFLLFVLLFGTRLYEFMFCKGFTSSDGVRLGVAGSVKKMISCFHIWWRWDLMGVASAREEAQKRGKFHRRRKSPPTTIHDEERPWKVGEGIWCVGCRIKYYILNQSKDCK